MAEDERLIMPVPGQRTLKDKAVDMATAVFVLVDLTGHAQAVVHPDLYAKRVAIERKQEESIPAPGKDDQAQHEFVEESRRQKTKAAGEDAARGENARSLNPVEHSMGPGTPSAPPSGSLKDKHLPDDAGHEPKGRSNDTGIKR